MPYAELTAVWRDGALDEAVPSNTAKPIELPAGTDATILVTLVDNLGQRVKLNPGTEEEPSTDKLEMRVRSPSTGSLLVKKQGVAQAKGDYLITIPRSTFSGQAGRLIFEVYAMRSDVWRQVVAPSHLILGLGYV